VTIDKPPNPILEPSEELRFSDNVLEVTRKLTNPMEWRIFFRVGTIADINQRYNYAMFTATAMVLDPKERKLIRFTLQGDFKYNNFFTIWTMYKERKKDFDFRTGDGKDRTHVLGI
jgi:hypothetical protein